MNGEFEGRPRGPCCQVQHLTRVVQLATYSILNHPYKCAATNLQAGSPIKHVDVDGVQHACLDCSLKLEVKSC